MKMLFIIVAGIICFCLVATLSSSVSALDFSVYETGEEYVVFNWSSVNESDMTDSVCTYDFEINTTIFVNESYWNLSADKKSIYPYNISYKTTLGTDTRVTSNRELEIFGQISIYNSSGWFPEMTIKSENYADDGRGLDLMEIGCSSAFGSNTNCVMRGGLNLVGDKLNALGVYNPAVRFGDHNLSLGIIEYQNVLPNTGDMLFYDIVNSFRFSTLAEEIAVFNSSGIFSANNITALGEITAMTNPTNGRGVKLTDTSGGAGTGYAQVTDTGGGLFIKSSSGPIQTQSHIIPDGDNTKDLGQEVTRWYANSYIRNMWADNLTVYDNMSIEENLEVGGTLDVTGVITTPEINFVSGANSIKQDGTETRIYGMGGTHIEVYSGGYRTALQVTSDGDVGINTTTPSSLLHIAGQTGALSRGLTFGDGDSGLYENVDDQFRLAYGGGTYTRFTNAFTQWGSSGGVSPQVRAEQSTLTNPVFLPIGDDANTGLGGDGFDSVSLIGNELAGVIFNGTSNSVGIGIRGKTPVPQRTLQVNGSMRVNTGNESLEYWDFTSTEILGGFSGLGQIPIMTACALRVAGDCNSVLGGMEGSLNIFQNEDDVLFKNPAIRLVSNVSSQFSARFEIIAGINTSTQIVNVNFTGSPIYIFDNNVEINGDLDQPKGVGNATINLVRGQMGNRFPTGSPLTIPFLDDGVYYNVSNMNHSDTNWMEYVNANQSKGGSHLIVQVAGWYDMKFMFSGSGSVAGGQYGVAIVKNFNKTILEQYCYAHVDGTSSTFTSTIPCQGYFDVGDTINVQVEDEADPTKSIMINSHSLNVVRIGG